MCEYNQNTWKKSFWQEIKDNCIKHNSPSEVIGWVIISFCLITFAFFLKLPWIVSFSLGIFVFLLAIPLNVNKGAVVMTATLFFVIWTSASQVESVKFEYRPYLSIDMGHPVRMSNQQDVFYGNDIILKNKGKIPAFDISTRYYIATDMDKTNHFGLDWYKENLGGYGAVSFVFPDSTDREPGMRSLSPSAEYYYFEAITSYKGTDVNRPYWTHVKKIFYVDTKNDKLYTVYTNGDWDRNRDFELPSLSTQAEVTKLIDGIKGRRGNKSHFQK